MHKSKESFIKTYLFSLDHKMIGKQFLWLGLFFLFFGGMQALLIRWSLSHTGEPVPLIGRLLWPDSQGIITPDIYNQLFTMHGTIMIFWAITPIIISALGNFVIPLQIGARDMAFPKLNMLSFWFMFAASLVLLGSFFLPTGAASGGWTSYPPLSTPVGGIPGLGQAMWTLALTLAGTSTMMGAINYVTTVIRLRAEGMTYFRMPLTVWGLWLSAILNAIFVPIIAGGLIVLLFDQLVGTHFFIESAKAGLSGKGGDALLFQHVFWIFGHPEVYILILPAWGIVSDLLAVFSRKPAFGYKTTALSMTTVAALSGIVWGHHMYTTGMSPLLGRSFMFLTLLISIPSSVFFLNWLATMWRGSLRFKVPMLFAMGVVFVFALGGLTGLYLAVVTTDMYFHDTMFVVGHFHYTLAASVLFASFAAIYYWFPKMFGLKLSSLLGKIHFWMTFVGLNMTFYNMMAVGYAGQHRRIFDPALYEILKPLAALNERITIGAVIMGIAQLIFVVNVIYVFICKKKSEKNPWDSDTLEWTLDDPVPHGNFVELPTVFHAPHAYNYPGLKGKDWVAQSEPLPKG